jgi:signal peptidase II
VPERIRAGRRLLSRLPVYFWLAAALTAAADLISKHIVFRVMAERSSNPIVVIGGFFRIVQSRNEGGVFGMGQGSPLWLLFGSAVAGLVVWFAHRKDARAVLVQIALGLVLGGAMGNLYDRIAFGSVRDFLDVFVGGWHWPAFNVADSGICVGAAFLALYAFFLAPKDPPAKKPGR